MTKMVYVVTTGEYSDYGIDTIFSKKDAADKYVTRCNEGNKWSDTRVEEYPIDVAREGRRDGLARFRVSIGKDGNNASAIEDFEDEDRFFTFTNFQGKESLHLTVEAQNEAIAIKIANEKRGQLIATEQWDSLKLKQ